MNPYELFWNYNRYQTLPYSQSDDQYSDEEIQNSLQDPKIRQLVLLMYKERRTYPTYIQRLLNGGDDDICDRLGRSTLSGDETIVNPDTVEQKEHSAGLDGDGVRRPFEIRFDADWTMPSTAETKSDIRKKGCKEDAVLLCDTLFEGSFHKSRLISLAKLLKAEVKMDWVKAVASKVVGRNDPKGFCMLDDRDTYKDRHIHYYGGIEKFINLYQTLDEESVVTFSLQNSNFAIHLTDFKTSMTNKLARSTLTKSLIDDSLSLTMLACSIGLPLRKMYTPDIFMSKWKTSRFKHVNRANIVRLILRDLLDGEQVVGNETTQLLLDYEKKQHLFTVDINKTNQVSTYFYNQWYSYPTTPELSDILVRLNAIKKKILESTP